MMSEGHDGAHSAEREASPVERPEPSPPPLAHEAPQAGGASRHNALWPAAALIVVVAGIALSPFWAPALAPLLPWGTPPAASTDDYAGLAARVAAIEQRPAPPSLDLGGLKSEVGALGQRVERLDASVNARLSEIEKHPVSPITDLEALRSGQSALGRRIEQLDAGVQQLDQRLGAVEAQSSSRAASEAAAVKSMQQEFSRLSAAAGNLESRLSALERQAQSQAGAERTDALLGLVLLQMREAVEQARPFAAEYTALTSLAAGTDLAVAAEPLAAASRNGVASRAVLSKRLAELAGQITTTPEPASSPDWGAQALARLRGLVTIRRIDGAPQGGPEAAVGAAQTALARGDLAGSVAALETLTGANADMAHPWLGMARDRLAVEKALDHLQELLAARLGNTSPAPAASPGEPSTKARTPS